MPTLGPTDLLDEVHNDWGRVGHNLRNALRLH
jgi:hypothetical protein